jgi:hypothetical protein
VTAAAGLQLAEEAEVRRNGSELPREHVMANARRGIRRLAQAGLSPGEIETRLEGPFNRTERELVWLIASHEVDQVRAAR